MRRPQKPSNASENRLKHRQQMSKLQSKLYRERNQEEYRAKARERMARKRAQMSSQEREENRLKQREHASRYYERNRNSILDKREASRYRDYEYLHGQDAFRANYRFRDVRPRELLDLKERDPDRYEIEEKAWQAEKARRVQDFKESQAAERAYVRLKAQS
ncbi:hypothetical protein V5O48_003882 [Marasmius crinis-equi]|uniref:Uncharacterized protein n=1 Tax=Marasmius crinis-equi TaxID=585013 RepID=A0ABR3FRK2_9AGAR